ncbi:hypothetical protein HY384_04490 [Candidatus Daviesbacteria bacterium]|nr:hypothetical protein [Candidatus Daviesbacteria bacterium]
MKKEWLIIFLLLLFTIPAAKALFIPGSYTSHDLTHHIMRQISMDKLLTEGQIPPKWSGELNNGYGYPVFLFNYPLPYLIGEVFHKAGFSFISSVKAVFVFSILISIIGMYLFLKELFQVRLAAILGAVFYLYAPIRFSNIYVSASVGAALAAGILPFVFYFMTVLSRQGLRNNLFKILSGSLSLGLLILSHNFTTLLFSPVILAFGGLLIWQSKEKFRVFRDFGAMFLLGLGMSAWFWLPAMVEKQYLHYDQYYKFFYKNQFISIPQLFHSPWGYGLSHPQNPNQGDMSYQLGLSQILVIIILIPVLWVFRKNREVREYGVFSLITFFIAVFMMIKTSQFVWEALPVLSIIQFPFRFSIVAVFGASLAAAVLIKYLPLKKLLFGGLLLIVLYANRNHYNINEVFKTGDEYYLTLTGITSPYGEDLPKWAKVMDKKPPGKLEFTSGFGEIRVTENKSTKVFAEVEVTNSGKLRFNQFFFPGWQIKIDGKNIQFDYLSDNKSYGLPIFDIEKGKHQILAEFKNTPIRNMAEIISVISVILWGGILCKLLIRK